MDKAGKFKPGDKIIREIRGTNFLYVHTVSHVKDTYYIFEGGEEMYIYFIDDHYVLYDSPEGIMIRL